MARSDDPRALRVAARGAAAGEAEREVVVLSLMSSPAGRAYMYDRLVRCHVFTSSFSLDALGMAFSEGERNVGLQDLADVVRIAPDQYVQMMREANDKEQADGRGSNGGRGGRVTDAYGGDSGSGLADDGEWDPSNAESAEPT